MVNEHPAIGMQCFFSFQTDHKHASCHCSVPTTPLPSVCSHSLPSAISLKPVFLQGSRKFLHQAFFADHPGLCSLSIIYSIGIFFCLFFVFYFDAAQTTVLFLFLWPFLLTTVMMYFLLSRLQACGGIVLLGPLVVGWGHVTVVTQGVTHAASYFQGPGM